MVSAATAFYIGYQYYNHDWKKEPEFPLNTHVGGIGATVFSPFLITSLISDQIKAGGYAAWNWLKGEKSLNHDLRLKAIEWRHYTEQSQDLSKEVQKKLLVHLDALDKLLLNTSTAIVSISSNKDLEILLRTISTLLQLPNRSKEFSIRLAGDMNPNFTQLDANFAELKKNYSPEVGRYIDRLKVTIATADESTPKSVSFFVGEKGTGKTRLAEGIAEAMGVPFITLSLEKSDIFVGAASYSQLVEKLSDFTNALIETKNQEGQNFLNAVISLEGVDKVFNSTERSSSPSGSEIHDLLASKQKRFLLKELGVHIDTSRFLFILSGNEPLPREMMSRCETVQFSAFDRESREKIARNAFEEKIAAKQQKYPDFSVTQNDHDMVSAIVAEDRNEGVQELLSVIENYIVYLFQRQQFPDMVEAAFDPIQAFSRYETAGWSLPRRVKTFDLRPQSDGAESLALRELNTNFTKLKQHYPLAIQRYIDELKIQVATADKHSQKSVSFFLGDRGTGKTRLAEHIAAAFGVPFIKISASGEVKALFGEYTISGYSGQPPLDKLSIFTRSLIDSKNAKGERFLNAVVFVDEVDKTLKSTDKWSDAGKMKEVLLEMLEPSRSNYTLKDLGVPLDLSRFIFILAGNDSLDSNIMSRCKTVTFPPFEPSDRASIAYANFDTKSHTKASAYGFSVTTEERSFVDRLVEADIAQGNAGVRTLLSVLDEYVNFLTQKKLFPFENAGDFDIDRFFTQYGTTALDDETEEDRQQEKFAAMLAGATVKAQQLQLQDKKVDEDLQAEHASIAPSEEVSVSEKKKKKRFSIFSSKK